MLIPGLIYRLFCPSDCARFDASGTDDKTFRPGLVMLSSLRARSSERLLAAIEIVNFGKKADRFALEFRVCSLLCRHIIIDASIVMYTVLTGPSEYASQTRIASNQQR